MEILNQYSLKAVEPGEEDIAMSFINEAKAFLKSRGVDQWQKGYPDANTIKKDIANQRGYFLMADECPLAYMCIDFEGEPAYDGLNGRWLNNSSSYGVLHRLAIGAKYRGRGLATISFKLAEALMERRKAGSFRIDTDENNAVMKHLLSKNGFTCCGTIWFDNSYCPKTDSPVVGRFGSTTALKSHTKSYCKKPSGAHGKNG